MVSLGILSILCVPSVVIRSLGNKDYISHAALYNNADLKVRQYYYAVAMCWTTLHTERGELLNTKCMSTGSSLSRLKHDNGDESSGESGKSFLVNSSTTESVL